MIYLQYQLKLKKKETSILLGYKLILCLLRKGRKFSMATGKKWQVTVVAFASAVD